MRLSIHTRYLLLTLLLLSTSLIAASATGIDPFVIEAPTYQIIVSENQYIIDFNLPDFEITDVDIAEEGYPEMFHQYGYFHSIDIVGTDDYDVTDNIGFPELPFFPIELLLPCDFENIDIHVDFSDVFDKDLDYYIAPAIKGSAIQTTDNGEYVEIERDEDYCSTTYTTIDASHYYNEYTEEFYSLSQPYDVFGSIGVTLSIHPFEYIPTIGNLRMLQHGRIIIAFDGGSLLSEIAGIRDSQTFKSAFAMEYFKDFPWIDVPSGERYHPRLLIVAATQDMQQDLQTFVEYKSDLGYNVTTVYLDEQRALGYPQAIRYIIQERDPDYVLLVGSLEQIPPYTGSKWFYNPYSDDEYHPCVGRWVVEEDDWNSSSISQQLNTIIHKTIMTEQQLSFYSSSISLLSGTGNGECSFYKNIKKIADDINEETSITNTIYDGRDGLDFSNFHEAIQNSSIVLYRGHGGTITDSYDAIYGSYIASPYMVSSYPIINGETIYALENDVPFPIGLGIACSLNTYETNNNFGSAWVRNRECGGVAFYGSTTLSAHANNNNLTKKIFSVLVEKTTNHQSLTISKWLYEAEKKYFRGLASPDRLAAIRRYSLIGDPTLRVYGRSNSSYFPRYRSTYQHKDTEKSIVSFEIFSTDGRLITRGDYDYPTNANAISITIPKGIYIVKYHQSNGEYIIDKIINN